jgi:hypothetical protein
MGVREFLAQLPCIERRYFKICALLATKDFNFHFWSCGLIFDTHTTLVMVTDVLMLSLSHIMPGDLNTCTVAFYAASKAASNTS